MKVWREGLDASHIMLEGVLRTDALRLSVWHHGTFVDRARQIPPMLPSVTELLGEPLRRLRRHVTDGEEVETPEVLFGFGANPPESSHWQRMEKALGLLRFNHPKTIWLRHVRGNLGDKLHRSYAG
jgi:hypothetical protein